MQQNYVGRCIDKMIKSEERIFINLKHVIKQSLRIIITQSVLQLLN